MRTVKAWMPAAGLLWAAFIWLLLAAGVTLSIEGGAERADSAPPPKAGEQRFVRQFVVHDQGLQWLVMANQGELSNPDGYSDTTLFDPRSSTIYPELEYPGGSETVFLYSGGLWVGALKSGVPIVSTATDGDNGTNEYGPVTYWRMASRSSSAKGVDDDGDWLQLIHDVNRDGQASFDFDGEPETDDDQDGQVDEETLNGVDDDGDGLVDEDVGAIDPGYASSGEAFINDDPARVTAGDANGDGDPSYDPEPQMDEDPEGDTSADFLDNDSDGLIDGADPDLDGDVVPGDADDDGDGSSEEDQLGVADQEWTTAYVDTLEEWLESPDTDGFTPLGVLVVQHTYQCQGPLEDDYIIFEYLVTNVGNEPLDDVCLGMFFDFDVGHMTQTGDERSTDDVTFYVDSLQLAVGGDPDGDEGLLEARWFGVTVVQTPLPGAATTYKNFNRLTGGEPVGNMAKYEMLSSGVRDPDELTEGDWRFLLGFGPLGNLSPGETLPLTIAVVNGVNVADLIAHAKLAKGIPVLSPAQDLTDQGPVFLSLGGGVPNPFRDHVTLSVHLSAPGELEAGIYDLQGRLVQALLRDSRPAGHHSLVWHSGCADPGVYVCRVTAGGERPSRRVVLAR